MFVEPEHTVDPVLEAEIDEPALPSIPITTETLRLTVGLASEKERQITQLYSSNGQPLAKGVWLSFSIADTSVHAPYMIQWTVQNHGKDAHDAKDLGHLSVTTSEKPYQWEHTQYRGSHTMTCEILKSGIVAAKTVHKVNIR